MAQKKYIVREGFVVILKLTRPDGQSYERTYEGGEEVALDEQDASLHLHKLEFASDKDRAAALEVERKAAVQTAAAADPAELIGNLVEALQTAIAASPAPAATA